MNASPPLMPRSRSSSEIEELLKQHDAHSERGRGHSSSEFAELLKILPFYLLRRCVTAPLNLRSY